MEKILSEVEFEVSFLLNKGKINEIQAKLLRSLIESTESLEIMMKLYPDLSVRKQILKIVQEISLKIKIPTQTLAEEISSPLDCYLQSRKRDLLRPSTQISHFHINQLDNPDLSEALN